jgi:hypothetical protein
LLTSPGQTPPRIGTWGGANVPHKNERHFRVGKFCQAAEPATMSKPVLEAAGELSRELSRCARMFSASLFGDSAKNKKTEWTETRYLGIIIKHEEMWCVRQAADGTFRFCLVYWKTELPTGQANRAR